jgi:hypothetical protein
MTSNPPELPSQETISEAWIAVVESLRVHFSDKNPDLQAVLFIIGLREKGWGIGRYTKEQKQDLMNLACCTLLQMDGYFRIAHYDKDGWPVWEQMRPLPKMDLEDQEWMLKHFAYRYFDAENLLSY